MEGINLKAKIFEETVINAVNSSGLPAVVVRLTLLNLARKAEEIENATILKEQQSVNNVEEKVEE